MIDTSPTRFEEAPARLTGLLGRSHDLEEIRALLSDPAIRLLTLTGPGGVGKTRLAFRMASDVLEDFPDGVAVVPLAAVNDPAIVLPTILAHFGVVPAAGVTLVEALANDIGDKTMLLVLDNLEHVIDAATDLSALLAASTTLKVLVTSRTPLRIEAEREFPVASLAAPRPGRVWSVSEIETSPAVALFVQRARAARPSFELREDETAQVVEICYRLGGLPLALELAAARIKMLSPRALLNRLDDSLDVLTIGARDAPLRHRSLRDAIAWSYDLLTAEERSLFRQLGVFAGGFTLEAAEAVVAIDQGDVLNGIASLVDKSMLRREESAEEDRFAYLEAIREYARDLLREHGEEANVRARHAGYYTITAESLEPRFMTAEEPAAMDLLSRDHGNLTAAMSWSSVQDPAMAARLTIALWYYWGTRGHFTEGRSWIERTIPPADGFAPVVRARLLVVGGLLAWIQGDFDVGGHYLEQAAVLFEAERDRFGMAMTSFGLSYLPISEGRYADAVAGFEDALQGFRALERTPWMILSMSILGSLNCHLGQLNEADEILHEALELSERIGYDGGRAPVLENLGHLALLRGDFSGALSRYQQALPIWKGSREIHGAADTLGGVAKVAEVVGRREEAVRMLGATVDLYNRIGFPETRYGPSFDFELASRLRDLFGSDRFDTLWWEGQQWSLDEAIAAAMDLTASRRPQAPAAAKTAASLLPVTSPSDFGLTARETDIARLLVEGRSTIEIANLLTISTRTVGTHVRNILAKLNVSSRAAAVAVLLRNGLV